MKAIALSLGACAIMLALAISAGSGDVCLSGELVVLLRVETCEGDASPTLSVAPVAPMPMIVRPEIDLPRCPKRSLRLPQNSGPVRVGADGTTFAQWSETLRTEGGASRHYEIT